METKGMRRWRPILTMLAATAIAGCSATVADTEPPSNTQELALADVVPPTDAPAAAVPDFTVYFEVSSAALGAEATAMLDRLLADPGRGRWTRIALAGHADRSGSVRLNRQLAAQRIEAVRRYLVDGGVAAALIETRVVGSRQSQRRPDAEDRRVEIFVTGG
jgi:outer membrane protein OmpA-like peptidoglycan-associated protein